MQREVQEVRLQGDTRDTIESMLLRTVDGVMRGFEVKLKALGVTPVSVAIPGLAREISIEELSAVLTVLADVCNEIGQEALDEYSARAEARVMAAEAAKVH